MADCYRLDPATGRSDEELLASLDIPMNWGLMRRGEAYISYLQNCYAVLDFDKCYAIHNIVLMLTLAFELSCDENGLLSGIAVMNYCIEMLAVIQYDRLFEIVCRSILHSTRCFLNYRVGRYDNAVQDYNIAKLKLIEVSNENILGDLQAIRGLMLFEQRTERSVEEAKMVLDNLSTCGTEQWFWNFIYLRAIRHQREMRKGLDCIETDEMFLIVKLILEADNTYDILRIVALYRRSYQKLKEQLKCHNIHIDTIEKSHRLFLFKEILYTFSRNPLLGLHLLKYQKLPIPNSRREAKDLIKHMSINCICIQGPDRERIGNYLHGLHLESTSPGDALKYYELSSALVPNFDCDLHAMILRVTLEIQPDPITEFCFLLKRYQRTDHQMIALLNLAYHYYVDQRDKTTAIHYWFRAFEVDPDCAILRKFHPIFRREPLRCIWNVRHFAMKVYLRATRSVGIHIPVPQLASASVGENASGVETEGRNTDNK